MKTHVSYTPRGTCSRLIDITLDGDVISEVRFTGGCSGNLQGIASLVRGMKVSDAIERLAGIRCGMKQTSCPDQLALALRSMLESTEKQNSSTN